jgi:hypothetical protein
LATDVTLHVDKTTGELGDVFTFNGLAVSDEFETTGIEIQLELEDGTQLGVIDVVDGDHAYIMDWVADIEGRLNIRTQLLALSGYYSNTVTIQVGGPYILEESSSLSRDLVVQADYPNPQIDSITWPI